MKSLQLRMLMPRTSDLMYRMLYDSFLHSRAMLSDDDVSNLDSDPVKSDESQASAVNLKEDETKSCVVQPVSLLLCP